MAFYVTRGCLDGWFENSRRRCETLLEAAALAEVYDYAEQDLVLVEDENDNDLHYYSSHFDDFRARATRAGFDFNDFKTRAAARAAKKAGKQ